MMLSVMSEGNWRVSWEVQGTPGPMPTLPSGPVVRSLLVPWLLLQGPYQRSSGKQLLQLHTFLLNSRALGEDAGMGLEGLGVCPRKGSYAKERRAT